jgi:hypothetical protein
VDALRVLCGGFPRDGKHGQEQQQDLYDHAVSPTEIEGIVRYAGRK